jgi:hypothetical protein
MLVSSSLVKMMFFCGNPRPHCPTYIRALMEKKIVSTPTEAMRKGSFFETLGLGSGAMGQSVEDLPRKALTKNQERDNRIALSKGQPQIYYGEKTIDQIRIESQAQTFKRECSRLGVAVVPPYNTQVQIYKQWSEDVMLVGELDIFPTLLMREEPELVIVDLKLTQDLTSTFGEFAWGDYESMDKFQGFLYLYLVRDIDFALNYEMGSINLQEIITSSVQSMINRNLIKFYFWVFDYKRDWSKLGNKFFPKGGITLTKLIENEVNETIRKTVALLEMYEKTGWQPNPCSQCDKCTLECELR